MKTSRGVIPLVAAVVGVVLMSWAFVTGISAALSGGGSGAFAYEVIFIAAGVLVLGALIWAIVNLARRHSIVLGVVTIFVALVPIVAIVALRAAAG